LTRAVSITEERKHYTPRRNLHPRRPLEFDDNLGFSEKKSRRARTSQLEPRLHIGWRAQTTDVTIASA
jgi:hypothetical protein